MINNSRGTKKYFEATYNSRSQDNRRTATAALCKLGLLCINTFFLHFYCRKIIKRKAWLVFNVTQQLDPKCNILLNESLSVMASLAETECMLYNYYTYKCGIVD